jgi:hypothetical protein
MMRDTIFAATVSLLGGTREGLAESPFITKTAVDIMAVLAVRDSVSS